MKRRDFLRNAVYAGGAAAIPIGAYTWRVEPGWLDVVERALPISGLPSDLEGRWIAQISDLHFGSVDQRFLLATFDRIRARQPAFVVCTGDWVTAGSEDAVDRLREGLERFPHGITATVGSLGNHDYGSTWRAEGRAAAITAVAEAAGVDIVRNRTSLHGGLQFVGLEDLWSGRFDAERAFRDADPEAATIVLSHNPDTADLPGLAEYQGWILSGHTHGGQCRPPFLPPPILPVRNRRYTSGAFDLGDGRHMYVNRGLGYILRVRFNVRPEVTMFRLERA